MHPGRSTRAQASALSHTGAMTGNYAAMRTLVAREGVVAWDGAKILDWYLGQRHTT
jgi:acyl-CoA synthetase (NDP forming)